jgi:O-antigen/teichoic acid export membrane protein
MATILADRIIILLFSSDYVEAVPILRIVAWIVVLTLLNPFLSHILFSRGEQHKSLHVAAVSLACLSATSLLLIPRWGGTGTALAVLLTHTLAFCLYFTAAFELRDVLSLLPALGRTVLATFGTSLFILALRNLPLLLLISLAACVYALLILVLRVPSTEEWVFARHVAISAVRQVGIVRRRMGGKHAS